MSAIATWRSDSIGVIGQRPPERHGTRAKNKLPIRRRRFAGFRLIAVCHDVVADHAALLTEWSRLAMSSKGAPLYEA